MTKVDIQDAYLHVPLHPSYQKFLGFAHEGRVYRYQALPFGYNRAPRMFTKIMRPILSHLRAQGVRCLAYIDDLIFFTETPEKSNEVTQLALRCLTSLGFLVSWKKCELTPSQEVEFLGFVVNTREMILQVPETKVTTYLAAARKMTKQKSATLLEVQSLLGRLNSTAAAVPQCRLKTRELMM